MKPIPFAERRDEIERRRDENILDRDREEELKRLADVVLINLDIDRYINGDADE